MVQEFFLNRSLTIFCEALSFFLPIILKDNMGFDTGKAQILTAPPYVFAAIITYTTGWLGDRYMLRGPIIVGDMVLSIVGTCLMGFHSDVAVRYLGVFLITAGSVSAVPATMAYQANNIRGQWKRAFCSAMVVGVSGIGGIAGSLVFRYVCCRPSLYPTCAPYLVSFLISNEFFSQEASESLT